MTRHTAPTAAPPEPETSAVEYYSGTVSTPDEGAAHRIDSAADVDPNIRAYGDAGIPRGGAGGYGGAGTK